MYNLITVIIRKLKKGSGGGSSKYKQVTIIETKPDLVLNLPAKKFMNKK